jgi:hypothetical protein
VQLFSGVRRSPFGVRRSQFTVQRSAFSVQRSPFAVWRSPFGVRRSPFGGGRRSVPLGFFKVEQTETVRLVRLKVRTNSWVEIPIGQATGCP